MAIYIASPPRTDQRKQPRSGYAWQGLREAEAIVGSPISSTRHRRAQRPSVNNPSKNNTDLYQCEDTRVDHLYSGYIPGSLRGQLG